MMMMMMMMMMLMMMMLANAYDRIGGDGDDAGSDADVGDDDATVGDNTDVGVAGNACACYYSDSATHVA